MSDAARRCFYWSGALFVIGGVFVAWGPDIYVAIAERAGGSSDVGLGLLNTHMTVASTCLIPAAASLLGAGVVIRAVTSKETTTD